MTAYTTSPKIAAREENIKLYRTLSGLDRLPEGKQYWTLSNRCDQSPSSELSQLVRSGLLVPSQFHGVDQDAELIRLNRIDHPSAHWYHGDWNAAIAFADFKPGLIYLDTKNESGRLALNLTASTMVRCPVDTVLLLNVCQSSIYREVAESEQFISDLGRRVPNLIDWARDGVPRFVYASNSTLMMTYGFRRQS